MPSISQDCIKTHCRALKFAFASEISGFWEFSLRWLYWVLDMSICVHVLHLVWRSWTRNSSMSDHDMIRKSELFYSMLRNKGPPFESSVWQAVTTRKPRQIYYCSTADLYINAFLFYREKLAQIQYQRDSKWTLNKIIKSSRSTICKQARFRSLKCHTKIK